MSILLDYKDSTLDVIEKVNQLLEGKDLTIKIIEDEDMDGTVAIELIESAE